MKVTVRNTRDLWRHFATIAETLGEVFEKPQLLVIEDYKPPRSLRQNARFHCMCRALAEFTGHTEGEIKDWVKEEMGPKQKIVIAGRERILPKSTTDWDKHQMAVVMEQLDAVCAEQGVYVEDS